MIFESIEECKDEIIKQMQDVSVDMAKKLKELGQDVIESQVSGITGHLAKSVTAEGCATRVEAEIKDDGFKGDYSWNQVFWSDPDKNDHHFFPMIGLEMGKTRGRGKTHIMEEWESKSKPMLDSEFLKGMRARNVPIE